MTLFRRGLPLLLLGGALLATIGLQPRQARSQPTVQVPFRSVVAQELLTQTATPPIRSVRVTLSSAQVLALSATPITLIAAPGANRMLIFEGATLYKPAGTAYANIAAGDDLSIQYGAAGIDVGVAEMTGFADQTTAQLRYIRAQTGALAAGTVSDFTPVANTALTAKMLTGEIDTGDSAFRLQIFYRNLSAVLN